MNKQGKEWTPEEIEELKYLHETGHGQRAIGEYFGTTRDAVRWQLKQLYGEEKKPNTNIKRVRSSDMERAENYKHCLMKYYANKDLKFYELLGECNLSMALPIIPEGITLKNKFLLNVMYLSSLRGSKNKQFDFINETFFEGGTNCDMDVATAIEIVKRNGYRIQKFVKPTEGHWEEV